jgi:antirestriction protein ArdC
MKARCGSSAYAMEELRAELASAFIAAELGIPSEISGHASYIESWLRALTNDEREIFRAAADA